MPPKGKATIYLKRLTGDSTNTVEMDEKVLFDLLSKYNDFWNDMTKTLVFPLLSDPSYCGPLGLSIVLDSTENNRLANVRGFTNEMKVLQVFKDQPKPFKLFSGVKIKGAKLFALASVFGIQAPDLSDIREAKKQISGKAISAKEDFEIEMDLIAISHSFISLIEIKSDSTEHTILVSILLIDIVSLPSFLLF